MLPLLSLTLLHSASSASLLQAVPPGKLSDRIIRATKSEPAGALSYKVRELTRYHPCSAVCKAATLIHCSHTLLPPADSPLPLPTACLLLTTTWSPTSHTSSTSHCTSLAQPSPSTPSCHRHVPLSLSLPLSLSSCCFLLPHIASLGHSRSCTLAALPATLHVPLCPCVLSHCCLASSSLTPSTQHRCTHLKWPCHGVRSSSTAFAGSPVPSSLSS